MPNAIITGATQGIGKAIAEKLLAEGFNVATCARTQADLDALQTEWTETYPGMQVITYRADMSEKQQVLDFAAHVLEQFSTIDILVNNAGLFFPGSLMEEPDGHLEQLMAVNLYSAYHITRSVIHNMPTNGKSHIFNLSSVAALKAYPNGGAYSITKYALTGFSDNLREEYKGKGIRVTTVCPGATHSRSWEGAAVAKGRLMEANDVAEIVWSAYSLSAQANVENIVMRPSQGDL